MRLAVVCIVSGAALLAACSPKSETKADGSAAPAAAGGLPAPAGPITTPQRKAGLWESSMSMGGAAIPALSSKMCLDASTEKLAPISGQREAGADDPACAQTVSRSLGGYVFDSVCKRETGTITTHGVTSGDFNSAYTVKVSTRTDPPPASGPAAHEMTISARWLGPCPAAMKPGDIQMPNGMTINMVNMPGAAGAGLGGIPAPAR